MPQLTPELEKNLRIFLSRVELKGSEVAAFNELLNVLFPSPLAVEVKPVDAVQEKKDA